jgi:serine protease Do
MGSSSDLMIGEWVVAIGNPFGFLLSNPEPAVTAGVVSGLGRNIIQNAGERGFYLDMIQTDASINPGNSGGPLVNALGQVIGVNSSIISQSGGSEGLGFAIPINRARKVAADLLASHRVRRAWVGLDVEPADSNRWGHSTRVRIAHIATGSPAAGAGLRSGAIVLSAAGRPVRTALDWEGRLLDSRVGEPLEVVVAEGTSQRTVQLVPRDLPSMAAERVRALDGFELITLTAGIRAERGFESDHGAVIVALPDDARDLGMREGDLIIEINRNPVRTAEDAAGQLRRSSGRGPVRVIFEREGQYASISFYVS